MNAVGANADERLNNAIVKIAMVASGGPVAKPTQDLAVHWRAYWDSAARRNVTEAARMRKLERYAQWYARAWALLTPAQRALAPDPRSLDVSFSSAVDAAVASILNGAQAAAESGKSATKYVAEQSAELAKEIVPVATGWLLLGVIGLGFWAYSRRKG